MKYRFILSRPERGVMLWTLKAGNKKFSGSVVRPRCKVQTLMRSCVDAAGDALEASYGHDWIKAFEGTMAHKDFVMWIGGTNFGWIFDLECERMPPGSAPQLGETREAVKRFSFDDRPG